MKQFLALGLLLLASQACSNGESQQEPVKKVVNNAAAATAEMQGLRHHSEDITPANEQALSLANLCEKVKKAPDDYSEEERIRCSEQQ